MARDHGKSPRYSLRIKWLGLFVFAWIYHEKEAFHKQFAWLQSVHILVNGLHVQWGKKVFSHPPIVQVLPLKKMREACNFHHGYTSTMTDKIRKKNPENHIVGFWMNLFANYGGK